MIEITDKHQYNEAQDQPVIIDEIRNFVEARWVSAPEAIWRILGFSMSGMNPAVTRLQVHLPNQQKVIFNENINLEEVIAANRNQQTTLTEYFKMNIQDPDARNLLYIDFPIHYVWNKETKSWKKRQRGGCIGRMYMAHPVKGATDFEELKTVNGITYPTFKESAQQRGYLENDNEYQICIVEVKKFQMPIQLHTLFATLLVFGDITDVRQLWNENFNAMAEDFAYEGIPEGQLQIQKVLQNLNSFLQRHAKTISDYDLPELLPEINITKLPQTLLEELSYSVTPEELAKVAQADNSEASAFTEYLIRIGSGTEPTIENDLIWLPDEMVIYPHNNNDLINSIINVIYPNLIEYALDTMFITKRAILTPLNNDVDEINN
ncbi:11583_t:CDS:2 [Acaulospora morrowiae]|uniref:11583_t:CDS:1 n=1 Tax=Acaulospora morrowiae TaxID=94023 RepID=A0A9N9CBV7_9GLOM|nr:11583_t:CDS:2 [Acaulospora morrowiae]